MNLGTVFTVRTYHLERFNELEAVELFRELLWAEATRIGIPRSNITVSLRTKTRDRGVDASVRPHSETTISNIIQEGFTRFQIKAGSTFKPWRKAQMRNELFGRRKAPIMANLKAGIKECVENDGLYVLVCFGHDLTDLERNGAEEHLKEFLSDCGYATPRVDVWGAGQLTGFLQHFPTLSLKVTGRLGAAQFETHAVWSTNLDMRKQFVAGSLQERLVNTIRDGLREAKDTHIRVCGPAGIGKTKLVLEATRAEDLQPLVAYFSSASSFINSGFLYEILREDEGFAAVIVIDECDSTNLATIWNKLETYSARCKLITIYGDYDRAPNVQMVEVPPLEDIQISQILVDEYDIPKDRAKQWATVCSGYPRVAHMVGWNLANNPEDILQPPATENVWDRFIAGNDDPASLDVRERQLVLRYLALFKRFGYGSAVRSEAQFIAEMIRRANPAITWPKFREIVKRLRERKILQGEYTLYITPKLLHIKLWVDWWDNYGDDTYINEILSTFPPTLLDWFFEMFEYASGSKAASKTVEELLSDYGPFQEHPELLKTERGARFFRILGEVEPAEAVKCLKHTVGQWTKDELQDFTEGRRHVIWLLGNTAKWDRLFTDSAHLLLALAEAENENWSNNASGFFAELFTVSVHPQLSVTEAPPRERFPILEEALQGKSKERRLLAVKACERALQQRRSGVISPEVRVFGKQPEPWLPKTYSDLFDVHRRAWGLLSKSLDTLAGEERTEAIRALLNNMRQLGSSEHFVDMVMDTIGNMISKGYVDRRKILEIAIQVLHYDKGHLSEQTRALWEQLKTELIGSDFSSLLKRYVGMSLIEDGFDDEGNRVDKVSPQLEKLAQQAVDDPSLLLKELPWLITTEAINGFHYGYLVGKHDVGYSLLEKIVAVQREATTDSTAVFTGGYLRALCEQDREEWEEILDSFAEDEQMQRWVPEFTRRAGKLTDKAGNRLLQLVKRGAAGIEVFREFRYGDAVYGLSENAFQEWIEYLLASKKHVAIYIAVSLYDRRYIDTVFSSELPDESTYELLTHRTLFDEMPDTLAQGGVMESFHWDRVARAFIQSYSERAVELAEVIIRNFGKDRTVFADEHYGPQKVLATILEHSPERVWKILENYIDPPIDSRAFHLTHWLRGRRGFGGSTRDEDEGMLFAVPPDLVWQWIDREPDQRAWNFARLVPNSLYREEERICWARELLVRYGEREDVRNELHANFSTEGWTGPASLHYQQKKEYLLAFRKGEHNHNVRLWINEHVAALDRRIEAAKLNEERGGF